MIDQMIASLSNDNRIEIRGFGSFALWYHREPVASVILKQVSR